jgi:hypothetical protein
LVSDLNDNSGGVKWGYDLALTRGQYVTRDSKSRLCSLAPGCLNVGKLLSLVVRVQLCIIVANVKIK